jgi:hypothetical protein
MDDFKQLTEQLLKFYIDTESIDDTGFENFFDDNSSIIGTGKHEFFRNLREFQESYKFDVKQRGKIRLKIRDLQQEEAELGDDQVLAYGSVVFTGLFEDGSVCFEMDTRFSIIYKKVNGKWLVKHLHQSVPDRDQMTGEEFSVTLGKQVEEAHRAISALGTAYYHISRLDLKTKKIELVKRSRKMELGISQKTADWDSQFEVIKDVIAEPFVQKYIDFFDTQTMAARLRNKESMSFEFKKKDGKWFLAMIVPQNYDKDGNVTSVLLANRDVTDEKLRELRQEEELREAKLNAETASKAKSAFLFNMSHDIRTPMNAIIGYADLASRHLEDTEKLSRYVDNIQICGRKLLSLLSNVLDLVVCLLYDSFLYIQSRSHCRLVLYEKSVLVDQRDLSLCAPEYIRDDHLLCRQLRCIFQRRLKRYALFFRTGNMLIYGYRTDADRNGKNCRDDYFSFCLHMFSSVKMI